VPGATRHLLAFQRVSAASGAETKARFVAIATANIKNSFIRRGLQKLILSHKKLFDLLSRAIVILVIMNPTPKTDTVSFTVKGQVVIPRWLRKDFEIDEGTRAVVYKHDDHIVLKPLTAQHYRRLRGSLKGTKAMEVFMSERKREREL
jgi:AbrB family looped-hinge helix DNA binding protein